MIRGAILAFAALLSACASGTTIVAGERRAATNPENIQVLLEEPAQFELVAVLTATSRTGFSPQQSLDHALAEIRQRAAAVGANAVIIDSAGQGQGGGPIVGTVTGGTVLLAGGGSHPNIQDVRARAVVVP